MLQTYEAMLEKNQIRWIDDRPEDQFARVWITIQPKEEKVAVSSNFSKCDLIGRLTKTPYKTVQGISFFSREQANAR